MDELLPRAMDGLAAGAACALATGGIALSLIVRRPINLSMLVAPAAAMVIGAWIGGLAGESLAITPLILTAIGSIAACCGIWWVIDQSIDRPMRVASPPTPLLTASGVLLLALVVIERAAILWPVAPAPLAASGDLFASASVVDPLNIATWIIAAAALGGVLLFMTRTKSGLAMRAVGHHPQTAGLLGINTERLIASAIVIAAALTALGGLLYGAQYTHAVPLTLLRPGFIAAIALIIAGARRPVAAVAVALGLGSIDHFAGATWPAGAAARDAMLVILGLITVLARPADRGGDGVATA